MAGTKLTYLRVKIKSLAAEAQIIRAEERKLRRRHTWRKSMDGLEHAVRTNQPAPGPLGDDPLFQGLRGHRINAVRVECRLALLAYGFLRGRTYQQIEQTAHDKPDFTSLTKMVYRFAEQPTSDMVKQVADWYGVTLPEAKAAAAT